MSTVVDMSPANQARDDQVPDRRALTDDEAEIVRTLGQLEQALFALHVQPVQERMRALARRIEGRLELPAGAIGTTHLVDGNRVVTVPASASLTV